MKNIYYKSGVYALRALENNTIYIGSTKCFKNRKNNHMCNLKKNIDYMPAFLGMTVEFAILEVCDNFIEREQYWIDFYKSNPLFKIINIFDAERVGSNVPQQFKSKMSNILKDRWKNLSYRKATLDRIKATQFVKGQKSERCKVTIAEMEDGSQKSFPSAKLAAINFGFKQSSVIAYINRKKSYKGIRFFYKETGPE
jgi:hypothetical protein